MPRRLQEAIVRQMFYDAGYQLARNFKYVNAKHKHKVLDLFTDTFVRMSLNQLKYKLKHDQRPTWNDLPLIGTLQYDLINNPQQQQPQQQQQQMNNNNNADDDDDDDMDPALRRFINKHNALKDTNISFKQDAYAAYKTSMPKLNKKRDWTYSFVDNNNAQRSLNAQMLGITYALSESLARIGKTNALVLDLETIQGKHRYFHVNTSTVSDLYEIFKSPEPNFDVTDSADNMLLEDLDYKSITFHFTNLPPANRHVRAGFFPFINTTSTDLSKYGIYQSVDDPRITEACIITAFRSSGVFTDNELNQIDDMIKVKNFPQSELKHIAQLFGVNIYVRHYKPSGESHIDIKDQSYTRSLKLMIFNDHYMLYEMIAKNKSNYAMIKQMLNNQQLRPMTDD